MDGSIHSPERLIALGLGLGLGLDPPDRPFLLKNLLVSPKRKMVKWPCRCIERRDANASAAFESCQDNNGKHTLKIDWNRTCCPEPVEACHILYCTPYQYVQQ